jgi:hypothetical protein
VWKDRTDTLIRERTGIGWRIAERVIAELAQRGSITLHPSLNRAYAWLISKDDLEQVIAYLGDRPPKR